MEKPPLIRSKPRRLAGVVAMGALGFAGLWWMWRFEPGIAGIYPQCTIHQVTGLQCPGCGSLRAVHAALHGRFLQSMRDNVFLWISVGLVLWWLGSEWKAGRDPLQARPGRKVVMFYLAGLALFTAFRNLPFPPFDLLSPER